MKYIKQHTTLIVEAVFLASLFAFALVLDSEFAVSLQWQFYLVMACLALLPLIPSLLARQSQKSWLPFLSFNLALLVLPFLTFTVSKSFILFHHQIRDGMTVREVQHLFDARFSSNGRFPRPIQKWKNASSLQFMMDATHDRVDSVFVYFKNGRVIRSGYMPD